MTDPAGPGTDAQAALGEEPQLRRPGTLRALDELVAQERLRQEARLAALRRLRGDAAALLAPKATDDSVVKRIGAALRRRRAPSEAQLRERFESAQLRTRRAAVFAEALAGLEGELVEEIARLRAVLVDLAADEATLDALLLRVRSAGGEAASRAPAEVDNAPRRALEAQAERARDRAAQLESQRDRLRATEDRLLHLVEGERMLAERLRVLRQEVEGAARAGAQRLDALADQLRALATTSDTGAVLRELETSLGDIADSLARSAATADDALQRDVPREGT